MCFNATQQGGASYLKGIHRLGFQITIELQHRAQLADAVQSIWLRMTGIVLSLFPWAAGCHIFALPYHFALELVFYTLLIICVLLLSITDLFSHVLSFFINKLFYDIFFTSVSLRNTLLVVRQSGSQFRCAPGLIPDHAGLSSDLECICTVKAGAQAASIPGNVCLG